MAMAAALPSTLRASVAGPSPVAASPISCPQTASFEWLGRRSSELQHAASCSHSGGVQSTGAWQRLNNNHHTQRVYNQWPFKEAPSEALMNDEEWQRQRREETKEHDRLRKLEEDEGLEHADSYRRIKESLEEHPEEDVKKAKRLVAGLIRSGSKVEELIEEAGEKGELTPLVLLVIKIRLELAEQENERDAKQALDLLYRRIEREIMLREASLAMVFLNELLDMQDGVPYEDWLQQCRRTMLDIFPPEDSFTILGQPGLDLSKHRGPIEAPPEDTVLLRTDFIREVDELISSLQTQFSTVVEGYDADAVALRLRQQEKLRALEQVKDLRRIAVMLRM